MPEGSPGTGFDIRRLFSPGSQAREGREDPRTEPHAPVHAAPENPTPITLEDMSDQGGVGSVSKAEATLTHPSARDTMQPAGVVHIASPESSLADHDKHGNPTNGASTDGPDQPVRDHAGPEPDHLKAITKEFYEHHPRAREFIHHIESGFEENPNFLKGLFNKEQNLAPMLYALILSMVTGTR